jgi:hypothetical protein
MPPLRTLALFLATALSAIVSAADPVLIAPKWVKGDKHEYELTKGRERKKDGKVQLSGSGTTPIIVEVLKATDEEVEIGWTFGETTLSDPEQAKNPTAKAMQNVMKGRKLVFTLNAKEGGATGVSNFDELKKASDEIVETLTTGLKDAGADKAKVSQVKAMVKEMFADEDKAAILWVREPGVLFFPVGEQLTDGKTKETDEELRNPFGGDPFPTKRRVALKADAKAGTADITVDVKFDEKATAKILEQTLRDLTKQLGKEPPNAALLKDFSMTDSAKFTVNTKTGWVERAKQTRTSTSGGTTQTDTVEFVRKKK